MILLWLLACGEEKEDTGYVVNPGPDISFELPTGRWLEGDSLPLSASINDADGVDNVSVMYRHVGSHFWEEITLISNGDGTSVIASGTIPDLTQTGVEFYWKATDNGAPTAVSYLPASGPEDYYQTLITKLNSLEIFMI